MSERPPNEQQPPHPPPQEAVQPDDTFEIEPRLFLDSLRQLAREHGPPGEADADSAFEATVEILDRRRDTLNEVWAVVAPNESLQPSVSGNVADALANPRYRILENIHSTFLDLGRTGLYTPEYLKAHHLIATFYTQLKALYTLSRMRNEHDGTPSLYDLDDSARCEVLDMFYAEWAELTTLAQAAGYNTLTNRRLKPLIYQDVAVLRSSLHDRLLPPERVVSMFMHRPGKFVTEYQEALAREQRTDEESGSTRVVSAREERLNRLAEIALKNERHRTFAQNRESPNWVAARTPDEVDEIIFAVCTQLVIEAAERFGAPGGGVWGKGIETPASEHLRPKHFYGKLENTVLAHLPVDNAFIDAYTRKFSTPETLDRETFTRIGVLTQMHSTGRGVVGESFVDVIIYFRNVDDQERRKINVSTRGNMSGDRIAEYLNREAYAVATLRTIRGLSNVLPGGLPEMGSNNR